MRELGIVQIHVEFLGAHARPVLTLQVTIRIVTFATADDLPVITAHLCVADPKIVPDFGAYVNDTLLETQTFARILAV